MNFIENFKRVWVDFVALFTVALLMIFLPVEAKAGLVSLFITKFILVSAAIIHAHITRKLLFSYINFSQEKEISNNVMVIVWYVIIIFAWSRGG